MRGNVLLGRPELERLSRGDSVTVRVKAGTTEISIFPSQIAQSILKSALEPQPKDPFRDLIDRLGKR